MSTIEKSRTPKTLDKLPELVLLYVARLLPRGDQRNLSATCRKMKEICRIAASEPFRPETVVVYGDGECCRSLIPFSKDVTKFNLKFDKICGFCVRLTSGRQGENCSRIASKRVLDSSFAGFLNLDVNLKYVYLDLARPTSIYNGCPSKELIKAWLSKHMGSVKVLCLHDYAITWIVGEEGDQHFSFNYLFPNVQYLEVNAKFASAWQIEKLLQITPNLLKLHVCGSIELQYGIAASRIHIVSHISVCYEDLPEVVEKLDALANKSPKLEELDLHPRSWLPMMKPSMKKLLKENHANVKRLRCSSLSFWILVLGFPQPYFPQCTMLTISCNLYDLQENMEPLTRLDMQKVFPQLQTLRILSSVERNEDMLQGIPRCDSNSPIHTVTTLAIAAFDGATADLFVSLKVLFPSVTSLIIQREDMINCVGVAWPELKGLQLFAPPHEHGQVLLIAALLGINAEEIEEVFNEYNEDFALFFHIVPVRPTIFETFDCLKRLVIKYHMLMDTKFLRRMVKILSRRKGSTVVDIIGVEFHEFYWSDISCD